VFIVILLAILVCIGSVIKSAWLKGIIGEYKVNSVLEKHLERENYTVVMKDVLLPTQDGTTQIDHIVFSRYGIFVIETKNLSNWIFANAGASWTQVIYKKKYKFQNPVRQNYKHLKAIEEITGIDKKKIVSLVVFTGNCQFQTEIPSEVIVLDDLICKIKSYTDELLDNDELRNCINSIQDARVENSLLSKARHRKHVQDIKSGHNKHVHGTLSMTGNFINPRRQGRANKRHLLFRHEIIGLIIALIIWIVMYNIYKQGRNHNTVTQKNIQRHKIEQPHQGNIEKKAEEIQQKKKQPVVIYSWTDDNGRRVYSNKGFPADKKYSNPKVEWQ